MLGHPSRRPLWRAPQDEGRSLRSVHAIAGVAEARHDVAVVVEMAVDRRGPDRHVRMRAAQPLDAFRRREQTDIAQVFRAASLRRSIAATAEFAVASIGSSNDYKAIGEIGRRLEEVLDRFERFGSR